ncbi:MAG: hypothetical protein V1702_04105 [Candidatus Woesearchaeota archaeon]
MPDGTLNELVNQGAYFVGYGTFVASEKLRTFLGISAALPYELVFVNGRQRFLGVAGGKLEETFSDGKLTKSDVGGITVKIAEGFRFNGVLYQVSDELVARLDEAERALHYVRVSIAPKDILTFDRNAPWQGEDKPVFTYAARSKFISPKGKITIVRRDINPDPAFVKNFRAAALTRGETFRDAVDATTFLADRKTPLTQYALPQ